MHRFRHVEPAILASIVVVSTSMLARFAAAQSPAILYSFSGGSDGGTPWAGLVLSGGALYGTTESGGDGNGTVFTINADGSGFNILHTFAKADGIYPYGNLFVATSRLWGTTILGGAHNSGTLFALNTDGTGFTNLYDFSGGSPNGNLVAAGKFLFGTTSQGGGGLGTLFAVGFDGTGYSNLWHFSPLNGYNPQAGLVVADNTLYGTTLYGGSGIAKGTVFRINTDGTKFTNLHSFEGSGDGANPYSTLAVSGGRLYGTTFLGGSSGRGTIFALNTDGTGFTNLYSFGSSDGANPYAGLVIAGNTLYGTTQSGGAWLGGSLFAINLDGTRFTSLCSLEPSREGDSPQSGLAMSDDNMNLYGTTLNDGASGKGVIFGLSLAPQLGLGISGTNLIVTWPSNYAGVDYSAFKLQFATNLPPQAAWNTSPMPYATVNGQYLMTFPVANSQQFFRLMR